VKERLDTPDGDFLDLEHAVVEGHPLPDHAPLVLKLHGLEGSAHSGYSVVLARALAKRGIRSVGLNFRSCGGEMNRAARFYHSGETGDLALVLDHLLQSAPAGGLGALGFSLGGNVLLKYLGEQGAGAAGKLRAAVAVSVPYDLAACADRMTEGFGRVYAGFFLYEGFGNAFLEAIYFRKPVVVNSYAVYARDIAPLGFRTVEIPQLVSNQSVEQTREILRNEALRREWAETNFALGLKHFSHAVARRKLAARLANLFGEGI
jgi:pimeloyl-ACP methyl ester carboxylesterase